MDELAVDRLVYGGSLYPPPDPPERSRFWGYWVAALAIAAWVVVALMVWPVLL